MKAYPSKQDTKVLEQNVTCAPQIEKHGLCGYHTFVKIHYWHFSKARLIIK